MPITALPTPPSRQDPANFPARADAYHAALPTFATEATALEQNVNAKEASAVAKAAAAATSETNALASKNAAAASEANALAYKNSADASKTAAETAKDTAVAQAGLAATSAASAASVLQQDLSAVTAAALHRSPNAVKAMFIYDASRDSDGGASIDRESHTSWYNEPLNGAWLAGGFASEAAARAAPGAATGAYFQLTTDGKHYKLNAGAGISEVWRGNKPKRPRLAAIVAEDDSATIYDLTEAGRPMWMRIDAKAAGVMLINSGGQKITSIAMLNGILVIGGAAATEYGWLFLFNFTADKIAFYDQQAVGHHIMLQGIAGRHAVGYNVPSTGALVSPLVKAVAMTVLPDAPIDVATGLPVPTIAVATAGGACVIKHDGTVVNIDTSSNFTSIRFERSEIELVFASSTLYFGSVPAGSYTDVNAWRKRAYGATADSIPALKGNGCTGIAGNIRAGAEAVTVLRENPATSSRGAAAYVAYSYATGYLPGDIRRAYLADTAIGNVSNPATVADRSYKAASATVYGTLARTAVAAAAQLVAYSGFSAANYLQEPYSADLDFGTGEWSVSAWVSYSTAAASTVAERSAATGPSIKLGTDATGKLVATAYDGTTTRTVTSTAAYNTGTWTQASASYKTDGKLSISVNGVEVASATGAALLTLNNASAVLTIGNSRALDAPFPGSIALVKLGATVPTVEQSLWMYEQEKQLFRDGAQCCLPDSGAIVDLAYDEAQDKWVAVSAANESHWTGLVRTATAPVSAGAISKVAAQSGVKLLARSTTSPGVDVSIPAYGLREELVKRAEAAARVAKNVTAIDFDATTGQTDFTLPVGYAARSVLSAGALKREGATKDWVRKFDGFRETVSFGVAPGNGVWVQIHAVKE